MSTEIIDPNQKKNLPIHAIVVVSTVEGRPTLLMLDADATGTAEEVANWAQQLGVPLIDSEPSGRGCGRIENIHRLIERHLSLTLTTLPQP